jgi:hypothetical protein
MANLGNEAKMNDEKKKKKKKGGACITNSPEPTATLLCQLCYKGLSRVFEILFRQGIDLERIEWRKGRYHWKGKHQSENTHP